MTLRSEDSLSTTVEERQPRHGEVVRFNEEP